MTDLMDFVQEVKRANDIVSVISSYIEVKQRGQNFWARCPFHGEKTPSFSINPHQQYYKCFGCQESGDVIKFVQQYESCSFMEALEILAKRANLKMPELAVNKADKLLTERKKKRDVYYDILRDTARFYWKCFYSQQGEQARQYMTGRGVSQDTLKKFGIGYSPDMFSLVNFLQTKYSVDDCIACGVLQKSTQGRVFDALAERVIVPIFDINNRVIAFGGRALTEKVASYGKYKNTQETDVFLKKNNLYAINFAKKEKQQANLPYVLMVEGYMDVIAMSQAGFTQCVASMGTSLTEQQAKLVSRLVDTVYICYDGDSAGQKATLRGLDILASQGLNVKVMSIPNNQDPDEYIRDKGKDAFQQLIEQALPLVDYKLEVLARYYNIDNVPPSQRNYAMSKYVKGAVKVLSQLDQLSQAQYIKYVSVKSGYAEEYLQRAVSGEQQIVEQKDSQELQQDSLSQEDKALYFVASCILNQLSFAKIEHKPHCTSAFIELVYNYIFECYANNTLPTMNMIYTVAPDFDTKQYAYLTERQFDSAKTDTDKQFFEECVKVLERIRLKKERDALIDKLKLQLSESQFAEINQQIEQINKQIDEIR